MADELIFYCLGLFTPFIGLTMIWILTKIRTQTNFDFKLRLPIPKKRTYSCPDCGAHGRHRQTCPRFKPKEVKT